VTVPVTVLAPPIAYKPAMRPRYSAITAVALLAAGCGGGSGGPTTSTNASTPRAAERAAFRYSACMRQHGVPNFPDPIVRTSPGHESIGLKVTPATTGSPSFKSARNACRGIMPEPSPAQIAQQQRHELEGKLAFARCMRRHGLNGFPDPSTSGEFTPAMVRAAGIDIRSPAVLAAAKACVSSSLGTISAADIQRASNGGP
jgi:hypothetical protein